MSSRLCRAVPAALVTLAIGAPQAAAGVTEYAGLAAGQPTAITAGPDGALWFTTHGNPGGIGRITLDGSITEFPAGSVPGFTDNTDPADIVTGPDGALWFTEQAATGAIARFDPATERVTEYTDTLTPNAEPTGIALGPDGNMWFTLRTKAAIGRITPAGDITEFHAGLPGSSEPNDIAAGPDGNLWFTVVDGVGRIDPGTGKITIFTEGLVPGGAPHSIVAASNGKLYFTQPDGGRIGRVTTDGKLEEYDDGISAGARPTGIAEGGDGALWFADAAVSGRLGRFWPDSEAIQELSGGLLADPPEPEAVTMGPDGNVWFTRHALPGIARVTVPPLAHTDVPAMVDGKVRLKAQVRPNSQATTYRFEYGRTLEYESQTATASAGDGPGPVRVSADVKLAPDAGYHVRVVAENASGKAVSDGRPFHVAAGGQVVNDEPVDEGASTIVAPPPAAGEAAPPSGGDPLRPAPPVLGETVTVAPAAGSVWIKAPGARRFVALAAGKSLPVGSIVDARRGKVVLHSARDTAGAVQKGTFWGAMFQVRQRRDGRGMTDLVLRGGSFASCGARASGTIAQTARRKRKPVRKLWGRDRHGRFRTHGRDSVATVRGTVWATSDRCAGTLTRVRKGKVLVRDLRRRRSVLLTAGESYFARHRR
jgi:streptogramin lyase